MDFLGYCTATDLVQGAPQEFVQAVQNVQPLRSVQIVSTPYHPPRVAGEEPSWGLERSEAIERLKRIELPWSDAL